MTKSPTTDASATNNEPTRPADTAALDSAITPSFWLLKDGTAPKLGARAEGGIRYQVLADHDRQHLYIAITGNESGGYFSRERVPFDKIEACLDALDADKPFPSKTFKEAFIGRSSNNAGFLVAAMRKEGLLCSFAGRIDPLSLTLPPGPRERRDPVVRPLEPQFLQVLMDLFQRAPLLA